MQALTSTADLLISSLGGLFLLAILMRFLLQLAKADFYNPVSQAVVRITNPLVKIFRGVIPGYKGFDFSTLLLALIIEFVFVVALIYLNGFRPPGIGTIITWSVVGVVSFIINIYFWAIIASVIMSFVMLFSGTMNPHPILRLIWQLTEPLMAPVRKIIPPMGGLDFSPMIIFIGIQLLKNLLIQSFGISPAIASVIIGI
ncbi:MAG: YggT family protein [Pseudohongiellaceae bacterium]